MFTLRRLVALIPLLTASACATAQSAPPAYSPSAAYAAWREDDYRYRIGAGDELALRFVINPDLNANVVVGPDGSGVFPLVGGVRLAGLTVDQANAALTGAYASVLRNPQVEALVAGYGSAQIYVGGQVKEPGVKPIKGRITITQAVMAAGGFADTAETRKIAVLRQAPGEPRPHLRVVDVRATLAGGDGGEVLLEPGDVVFAPRSSIGELDLWVKQYITDLIPFGFSYGISSNGR